MRIIKYNSKKDTATTVVNEYDTVMLKQRLENEVQRVAAATATDISMTATINADGELIMSTDIYDVAEDGGELSPASSDN
jgi:hypothetical protein